MDKKSVILFVSFLFMLGVVLVMADIGPLTHSEFGDGYEVSGWTRGGVTTTINLTIPASGGSPPDATITNITILIDDGNYTWMFVDLGGDQEDDLAGDDDGVTNVTFDALGAAIEWNCTNVTGLISCYNNSAGAVLNASLTDNSSITILINLTGALEETSAVNWTIMTGSPGTTPESTNNASEFTLGNDGLDPRLIDLNISDGRGQTYYNGTNMSGYLGYWIDGTGTVTVAGTLTDLNLETKIYLYCSGNTTWANQGNPSVEGGAESITAITVSGTTSGFSTTLPATCLEDANVTSFFIVANDSLQHFVDFNDTLAAAVPFQININSTRNPKLGFVNVTQSFTDSDGNSNVVTHTSTSGLTGGVYLNARLTNFSVELSNLERIDNVSFIYRNGSTLFIDYGNGNIRGGNISLMFNESEASDTGLVGTTVFTTSLDLSGDVDNVSYEFYFTSNNSGNNYTTQIGPFRFEIDAVGPNEPTMTLPDDRTIIPRGSITYKCSSSDGDSGVSKIKWKLTKPDGTIVTTSYGDVSAGEQSKTFTGDDTASLGAYTVECIAMDAVGNTATHASTSTQTFQVSSSVVDGEDTGGSEGGEAAPSFDIDFSTSEEATLKVPQGTIKTFTFDGSTEHTITFSEVTATTVTLTISSTPVTVTLVAGETKNVDLNADGVNDLVVKLNGITDNKADVTISKIKEGAELIVQQEQQPSTPTPEQQPPAGQEQPPAEVEEQGSSAWIWITLIIIIAVVVAGYFLLKKRKQ